MDQPRSLTLADGGTLQYFLDDEAPAGAGLLVYHHGTPGAGPLDDELLLPAREAGLRIVELVRPGYGLSTRAPGRAIVDVVPLVTALADHLGYDRFVTLGWSGGGPHALATVAMLPDRCAAALCLAGVAPYEAEGLDYLAGMGADNIEEFGASVEGEGALAAWLAPVAAGFAAVNGDGVIDAMASLLPAADRAYLTGEAAQHMADELRWSVEHGIWGWLDDDLAFVGTWGFDVRAIAGPVLVWQGSDDLMVPFAHGEWLAAHIGGAVPTLVPGEGHLSIVSRIGAGFADLRRRLDG
jgi:pimeloyl-ACP methyl ester carboxylesterase